MGWIPLVEDSTGDCGLCERYEVCVACIAVVLRRYPLDKIVHSDCHQVPPLCTVLRDVSKKLDCSTVSQKLRTWRFSSKFAFFIYTHRGLVVGPWPRFLI
jgi:hypothetical protein